MSLLSAVICEEGGTVALVSDIGRVLCLPVEEHCLPLMGKLAQGPMTMRMLPGENLIGAVSQPPARSDSAAAVNDGEILIGTRSGALSRLSLRSLRRCKRGDLGEIALRVNSSDDADHLITVCDSTDLVGVVTSSDRHGRLLRTSISTEADRPTQLTLKEKETLTQLVPLLS